MRGTLRPLAIAGAVIALALTSVSAGPAVAASGNAVINDCQSFGKLTHNYTLQELRHALAVMPASVKQYTSCYDVITQGILTVKAGKTTGPKGGGGSFLPTPVIIILVVLILAGVTFGAIAIRQRRASPGDGDPPDSGTGPSEGGSPPAGDGPAA
ncbi:MAG: hypothetical protein ACRDPM_24290 [Solirubrobacteraceae bacterium]